MGYTHSWRQHRDFSAAEWETLVKYTKILFRVAKKDGIKLANGLGDVGTKPEINTKRIFFNGEGDDSYETFHLTREKCYVDYISLEEQNREGCFSFCKTQYRPYDPVVVTILVMANKIAPDAIKISSDGGDAALTLQFNIGVELLKLHKSSKS